MTLTVAKKPAPDSTPKAKRDGSRGAPTNSHQSRGGFSVPVIQRKPVCACGGGCPRCKGHTTQDKPKVGQTGNSYEQGAEQVTDQYRINALASLGAVPPLTHEVLRSPGEPLDPSTRAFMEPRFGHDFSQVRVHTDTKAVESARAVNALAYTVGRDIVFGARQYAPVTAVGRRLLAHELAHVVQQANGSAGVQAQAVGSVNHPSEPEAERAAEAALAGERASIRLKTSTAVVQRAKGDMVAYGGGTGNLLSVLQGGKLIFTTLAASGHPGSKEFEKGVGPIPAGTYQLHPAVTQPTVSKMQSGVCGANAITSGYQEITSNDPSPCADPPSHYCTVDCPTAADPGRKCFTPKDCWGEKRIKIEGTAKVAMPTGGFVTRSGFYIHGGNHSVAVTSGCIKVFDDAAFTHIRKLEGGVPLCVGTACPSDVGAAIGEVGATTTVLSAIGSAFGLGTGDFSDDLQE